MPRRKNRFLDFALGVVGLAAAGAIITGLLGYSKLAIITIGLVFIGAVLLFAASQLLTLRAASYRLAANFILWPIIIVFIIFLGFTVSAFAVGQPCNWADFLQIRSACSIPPATDSKLVEGNLVTAYAGGRGEPNPGCRNRTLQSCVTPQNGGRLVPGSGSVRIVVQNDRTSYSLTVNTDEMICFELSASTGACEQRHEITGRAVAKEVFTLKK